MIVLEIGLRVAILIVLIGMLTAIKSGFNEIINGLEAVAESLDKSRRAPESTSRLGGLRHDIAAARDAFALLNGAVVSA